MISMFDAMKRLKSSKGPAYTVYALLLYRYLMTKCYSYVYNPVQSREESHD